MPEILLVGNPNTGKTTLFNFMTGLRSKTSNFPGTTLEVRIGTWRLPSGSHQVVDMPGIYSLLGANSEERVAIEAVSRRRHDSTLIVLVMDATQLERNLYLTGQVLRLGMPTVAVLTMKDIVERSGAQLDLKALEQRLGCPVVLIAARSGRGVASLVGICDKLLKEHKPDPTRGSQVGENLDQWARETARATLVRPFRGLDLLSQRVDRFLIHPVGGVVAFLSILFTVFYLIFSFATLPMDFIDATIGSFGAWIGGMLPAGTLNSLLVDGVIAGVGGVIVFLPQICILFFCLSILEDSGYLARAACSMDGLFRRVGLPGKAFVPFLSAHACAIPAIMSTRVLEDRKDRLIVIMVLPLLTCSARLPVYAMVTALLFPGDNLRGAAVFTGAYAMGITAAITMAWIFRRTFVKTPPAPLLIELPSFKRPSLRTAGLAAYDRGMTFIRRAGTVILAISIVLWWLMNFPGVEAGAGAEVARSATAAEVSSDADLGGADEAATADAGAAEAQAKLSNSYAGRLGHLIEPVIEPLGFDWKIGVALVASFAAREVVVSALSVIYGVGEEAEEGSLLIDRLREAKRPDGTPVFGTATSVSLLVFYVLAMQCLPTQAVTRRETGSWKWAGLQLGYMTLLAYVVSLVVYQALKFFGA